MEITLIACALIVVLYFIYKSMTTNDEAKAIKILERYDFVANHHDVNLLGSECIAYNEMYNLVFIGDIRKCKKIDIDEIKSVSLINDSGHKILLGINIEIDNLSDPLQKFYFINLTNNKESSSFIGNRYEEMLNKAEAWVVRLNRIVDR